MHHASLRQAQALLAGWVSGPAREETAEQLAAACNALWHAGRRQCGAVSVTGRPCTLPMGHAHDTLAAGADDTQGLAPVLGGGAAGRGSGAPAGASAEHQAAVWLHRTNASGTVQAVSLDRSLVGGTVTGLGCWERWSITGKRTGPVAV